MSEAHRFVSLYHGSISTGRRSRVLVHPWQAHADVSTSDRQRRSELFSYLLMPPSIAPPAPTSRLVVLYRRALKEFGKSFRKLSCHVVTND
jgi:hypothetical protein